MKKCIITVVGKDSVGIIAKVCTYLAETNINILNISQTIVDGYFNMMAYRSVSIFIVREKRFLKKCTECKENRYD